jgi:hypothetical protein
VPDAESLRRLAYLMLAPSLGRRRRAGLATAAAAAAADAAEPTTALVAEVLHTAGTRTGLAVFGQRSRGGPRAAEAARGLGALYPAARVAYVLARLEQCNAEQTAEILRSAGVADPETAIVLAEQAPLDPAGVRLIEIPGRGAGVSRLVVGGVAAAVLGIAAPVIAVTTGGGSHPAARPRRSSRP